MHSDAMGNGLSRDVEKIIIACGQACMCRQCGGKCDTGGGAQAQFYNLTTSLRQVYEGFVNLQ